jgi:ribosomal-protein-alanine N-acetyltransferase
MSPPLLPTQSAFVLTTNRLALRPVDPTLRDGLHALFADPAVRRYLLDDQLIDLDWIDEVIATSQRQFAENRYGLWAVYLRNSPVLIGACGYAVFDQLQLLYALRPAYWKQGFATEAARAVVGYGFQEAGLTEIVAAADLPNTASFGVMERLGMKPWKTGNDLAHYRLPKPTADS